MVIAEAEVVAEIEEEVVEEVEEEMEMEEMLEVAAEEGGVEEVEPEVVEEGAGVVEVAMATATAITAPVATRRVPMRVDLDVPGEVFGVDDFESSIALLGVN